VDDQQLGALIRAVRIRRGLRQEDVARVARVSRTSVSTVELGLWQKMPVEAVRAIASAVGVRVEIEGRYRGSEAARLLSHRHSLLADSFSRFAARQSGWIFEPEVSFSVSGEYGVLDDLGWNQARAHLLIVELKTEFADMNAMLGTVGRYLRLARAIARARGWEPKMVSVWLIVLDTRTNRRHAAEHSALLRARFPTQGPQLRQFLANPDAPVMGMSFWTYAAGDGVRRSQAVKRVRVSSKKRQSRLDLSPNCPSEPSQHLDHAGDRPYRGG
jgi:transcriptional regulator with XRE-family HTH domain